MEVAFEARDGSYRRYVDDGIILIKNRRQYAKAKRRLFEVLRSLKLVVSPQKTKMGKLSTFHFLGVAFEVSRNPQNDKNQVSATMHNRCCARALARVVLLRENAVNKAIIQGYLSRWAAWWKSMGNWNQITLLQQWVSYAQRCAFEHVWLGSGLVAFERLSD